MRLPEHVCAGPIMVSDVSFKAFVDMYQHVKACRIQHVASNPMLSYHEAVVTWRDAEYHILTNKFCDYSRIMPECNHLKIAGHSIMWLSAEELAAPLLKADISHLSSDQIQDISYWKPANVNELLFNFWD